MKALFTSLLLGLLPALAFAGATSSPPAWVYPGSIGLSMPVIVSVKNMTVLTSGSPADIGMITLPSAFPRWTPNIASSQGQCGFFLAETAVGTLVAGTFGLWTGPNGTGTQISTSASTAMPAGTGQFVNIAPLPFSTLSVAPIIYVHQSANSANAGTASVYLHLYPCP